MLKTRSLCTDAGLNLGDRVLGKIQNSFIALASKTETA